MFSDSWNAPWFTAASPKKQRQTRSSLPVLDGPAHARGQRDLAAHDAPAAEEVLLGAVQVHGAALAPGAAVDAPVQLRHDLPRAHALGQRLDVVAVGRDDVIVVPEGAQRADRHGLLADVEVAEAADLAQRVRLRGLLLETAAQQHDAEHPVQLLLARTSAQPLPATAGLRGAARARLLRLRLSSFRASPPSVSPNRAGGPFVRGYLFG